MDKSLLLIISIPVAIIMAIVALFGSVILYSNSDYSREMARARTKSRNEAMVKDKAKILAIYAEAHVAYEAVADRESIPSGETSDHPENPVLLHPHGLLPHG